MPRQEQSGVYICAPRSIVVKTIPVRDAVNTSEVVITTIVPNLLGPSVCVADDLQFSWAESVYVLAQV